MKKVLVISENLGNACELIAGAKQLGEKTVVFFVGGDDDAKELAAHGAERIVLFDRSETLTYEAYADEMAKLAAEEVPALILVGMTNRGRTVAGVIAQALQAPCVSEVKKITVSSEGQYVTERRIYGGKATVTEKCVGNVLVVTVPLRSFEAEPAVQGIAAEIVHVPVPEDSRVKLLETIPKGGDSVDITAASTIVLFGRGLDKKDDMVIMEELASQLGGVTACTRPCAVDYGWLPHSRYVGLSGKTVKPALYIDIGSSGQIQQIAGATDSKIIVAINKKESEPVFKYSDYGIVGDLYEIVPELTKQIKALH